MIKRVRKAGRTRHLEEFGIRCENRHPNLHFIRCEFSTEEYHNQHIGDNGKYVWWEESRNPYKKYLNMKGEEFHA